MQLIVDLTPFRRDTQQVVGRRHTRIYTGFRLLVQRIHLRLVGLQHTYFPIHGDQAPIGIVGISDHLHTGLAQCLTRRLLSDFRQFITSHDLTAGIDRLRHRDSGEIHAMQLHGHPVHLHVWKHIGTRNGGIELR